MRSLLFENISVTGPRMLPSWMRGLDAEHDIRGVRMVNLRFNGGRLQTAAEALLRVENDVHDVVFDPVETAAVAPGGG